MLNRAVEMSDAKSELRHRDTEPWSSKGRTLESQEWKRPWNLSMAWSQPTVPGAKTLRLAGEIWQVAPTPQLPLLEPVTPL